MTDEAEPMGQANAPSWDELEVRKRTLNFGSAGVLDAPDFDLAPTAEGKATIRWKVSGRKETPLKDGSVEITTILTITKIDVDAKSIIVPIPQPKLPFDGPGQTGALSTLGAALDDVLAAVQGGAEIPPHQFQTADGPFAGWTGEGDPPCSACGLAESSGVHVIPAPPASDDQVAKKRASRSGTLKAARRPRARG